MPDGDRVGTAALAVQHVLNNLKTYIATIALITATVTGIFTLPSKTHSFISEYFVAKTVYAENMKKVKEQVSKVVEIIEEQSITNEYMNNRFEINEAKEQKKENESKIYILKKEYETTIMPQHVEDRVESLEEEVGEIKEELKYLKKEKKELIKRRNEKRKKKIDE